MQTESMASERFYWSFWLIRSTSFWAAALVLLSGCSIAGSWKTVETTPRERTFPVDVLTLTSDGRFTATGWRNGEPGTRTGTYRWSGSTLRLEMDDGTTVQFAGRRRTDGSLLLIDRSSAVECRAVLTQAGE